MVMGVINPTGCRGFVDWAVQRITAIVIGIYTIFLLGYFFAHQPLTAPDWQALFQHVAMKLATFVVLVCILWHAWIGIWTVLTDYVKSTKIRVLLEIIVILLLLAYVAWMFEIFWGI
jgi:succinate dehydrogenase / fumarate reductase membrane anchor subunit